MACNTSHAKNNSGLLDEIVRIIEFCSDDCNILLLTDHQHFLDPARTDHFHIIIKEEKITSLSFFYSKIIDCSIVEPFFPCQYPCLRITPGKVLIIFKSLLLFAVVLDDQNLVILPGRFLINRRKTFLKIINMVFIRNNDRHKRLALNLYMAPVPARVFCHLYFRFNADSAIMFLDCTASSLICISFALRIRRNRIHMTSPVIQHFRNMNHLFRLLAAAQNKIIILRAVKLRSEATDLIHQCFLYNKNMADIIIIP